MKKSNIVGVAVTDEIKKKIEDLAKEKRWTISSTIFYILEDYFKRVTNNEKT